MNTTQVMPPPPPTAQNQATMQAQNMQGQFNQNMMTTGAMPPPPQQNMSDMSQGQAYMGPISAEQKAAYANANAMYPDLNQPAPQGMTAQNMQGQFDPNMQAQYTQGMPPPPTGATTMGAGKPSPGLPPQKPIPGQPPTNPPSTDQQGPYSPWQQLDISAANQWGGQQIAGATPDQADYNSVQQYADAAHQNARRYLDPQQAAQNRRLEQEIINKGVDPNSAAGKEMASQLAMQQADANNAAAFGAMQFGQNIQNQMAQQKQQQADLAGRMQQGWWGTQLGMGGLDVQRGAQSHQELMDMLGYDMDVRQYNDQNQLLQDMLFFNATNVSPVAPGQTNPYTTAGSYIGQPTTTGVNISYNPDN